MTRLKDEETDAGESVPLPVQADQACCPLPARAGPGREGWSVSWDRRRIGGQGEPWGSAIIIFKESTVTFSPVQQFCGFPLALGLSAVTEKGRHRTRNCRCGDRPPRDINMPAVWGTDHVVRRDRLSSF